MLPTAFKPGIRFLTILLSVLLGISGTGCFNKAGQYIIMQSDQLEITQLKPGIYQHISYLNTESFGRVPCNGMVFIDGKEAIIFDTPTNHEASAQLIRWVEQELKTEIKAVVITHFHEDCLGGIEVFHQANIPSLANQRSLEILKSKEAPILPQRSLGDQDSIRIGQSWVQLRYFGEGHTRDNIVGYIPTKKTLFGGCLIKETGATKGYLGDANTEAWPNTVAKIKSTWPELKIVVPGHGKSGGAELLDYTIKLFGQ